MVNASDIYNGKILIVDDRETNVIMLRRMLLGAGYFFIMSTTDPYEVSELHSKNRYDLILLDLQMPGMDGFQVMETLKVIEENDYIPVLVISAQPDQKMKALKAGAKDFINKPFDMVEVLARVSNMLEVRLLHKRLHNLNGMMGQRLKKMTVDLRESYLETIFAMTQAVERQDEDAGVQIKRMDYYVSELARLLSSNEVFADNDFLEPGVA